MRTLSRPMFNMGGPIKQGIMHGIREPKKHGGPTGTGLVGDKRYPKTKGREHHGFFLGALPWLARFGPAAVRGFRASRTFTPWAEKLGKWGRTKDIFLPKKSLRAPMAASGEGAGFTTGSFLRSNPLTSFGIASMAPQAGYLGYKAAKAAPGTLWKGTKKYADMVIPGDQSSWWKDPEPPTGIEKPGGFPSVKKIKKVEKELSDAERKAFADAQRDKRVEKYLELMGYDRSKKMAVADALIDASKIVSDRGTLDKKNITAELINPIIQATSKRFDKPDQIREAVGLMATKAEIEKDISKEKDALAKQLTMKQIKLADQKLEEGFETDIRNLLLTARTPPDKKQLEQYARLTADKYGESFTKVEGEGADVSTDGIYMIEGTIVRVTDGVPKRIV